MKKTLVVLAMAVLCGILAVSATRRPARLSDPHERPRIPALAAAEPPPAVEDMLAPSARPAPPPPPAAVPPSNPAPESMEPFEPGVPDLGNEALNAKAEESLVTFNLENSTLYDLVPILSKELGVPVVIEPGLASARMELDFKNASVKTLLSYLLPVLKARCDWVGGMVLIRSEDGQP